MKKILLLILFLANSFAFGSAKSKGVVYFDLGDTLINKINFNDPKARTHYMPGAYEHMKELKDAGYLLGLITNIPDEWGKTKLLKIAELKKVIRLRWEDKVPFDWNFFENRVFVPPKDELRKPNPYLFSEVRRRAGQDMKLFFEGEDPIEVSVATAQGFGAYQVFRKGFANFPSLEEVEKNIK